MTENISIEKYRSATRQVLLEEEARGLRTQLIVFVVVNVAIAVLNFILLPEFLFFYFALIGWGVGLAIRYLLRYRRRGEIMDRRERRIDELARR